jgi:hypothetical protein
MRPSRSGLILAGILVTLVPAAVSGCDLTGSDGEGRSPTAAASDTAPPATPPARTPASPPPGTSDAYKRARKLTECMRANGIPDFPDPQPDGRFSPDQFPRSDLATLQRVFLERCSQYSLGRH